MKLFIALMIALMFGANYYVLMRLWQMLGGVRWAQILILAGGILAASSFFLYFFVGKVAPMWVTSVVYRIGTTWVFVLLYLLIFFVVADLLRLVPFININSILRGNPVTFLILAVMVTGIFSTGYFIYRKKDRVSLDIGVAKNMSGPLRIVAVSDLHIGYGVGAAEFRGWVHLINAEKPDVVLIGGDLIDSDTAPLYSSGIKALLGDIKSRYGVYMIPGNHEYISGIAKSLEFMEGTGVTMLRDSVVRVADSFYIVGRDDKTNTKRKPLAELVRGLDPSLPVIMMDHQPYNLEEAEENGIDFQFSGHTHRGQVWPINYVTDRIYEDSHGYLKKGNTHYYVSSGLGIWGGKFRLGSRSEYIVIDMYPL